MEQPRTTLTEIPNQTEKPHTATKTEEIVLVPAVGGDESPDEDSFEADEDEESWDDVGSDSDTHVDNAGVDSENLKVYGDVDDGPIENVVDPQENDEAHAFDEQIHDLAPDAGVGDAPESSAQDSRDDNDAGTSHETDGGLNHGDGEADGKGSSASFSGEVENSTDITTDATLESTEGKEGDGGTPTRETPVDPDPIVDSPSAPETRTDADHRSDDEFPFDFVEPSGLGPIPTFDFGFDSTFDHIEIPNITVHSPTASHAGTEAGDESIEASVNTEGRNQAAEGDAKNAFDSSSSDTVPDASGPEGAKTTEADAREVAEGSGDAAAEGDEDKASTVAPLHREMVVMPLLNLLPPNPRPTKLLLKRKRVVVPPPKEAMAMLLLRLRQNPSQTRLLLNLNQSRTASYLPYSPTQIPPSNTRPTRQRRTQKRTSTYHRPQKQPPVIRPPLALPLLYPHNRLPKNPLEAMTLVDPGGPL
ncbi:hypothetical protein IW262DRAFT_762093 [Armillaria fumosa]|nr:hypothetical protein IW262DRAFT_762093 [Armillaria fumosa]